MNRFWDSNTFIQGELDKVVAIMKNNAKNREKIIETALLELIESGGKLLRPGFLIIAGSFGNYNSDKLTNLAAVVEMLHMATLVHDDIIDDAKTRRGNETIQSMYGKDLAVFIGDILFCRCFMTLSTNTTMENMKLLSEAIFNICTGEIEQYTSHFSQEASIKKYLRRIASKTAALFSMSLFVGAAESGCSKEMVSTLSKIGYDIGMAFQIIDDILDYTSSNSVIGKPAGNDLKQGIFTLPLIYSLRKDRAKFSKLLDKSNFGFEDVENIINLVKDCGGLDDSRALAKRYTERAFNRISSLPDCEGKLLLNEVAEKLLSRTY